MAKENSSEQGRAVIAEKEQKKSAAVRLVEGIAERLSGLKILRDGVIQFRFTEGESIALRCQRGRAVVTVEPFVEQDELLVRVFGDRARIQAIVDGKKKAQEQYLAGGLLVSGDLDYLSDLALELGILDEPL